MDASGCSDVTEIPKFLDALEDAGMEKLVEEKQTQYDTWRAENK